MTFSVCWLYASGRLERIELWTLDLRFRSANPIVADSRIAMIDIRDRDLDVIGRWPWPRDIQAALISIPAELGAKAILVDLTYSESETLRASFPADADLIEDPLKFSPTDFELLYPDLELQQAIRDAGSVYLAFHYPAWNIERSDDFAELISLIQKDEDAHARALAQKMTERIERLAPRAAPTARPYDRARLVLRIEQNPSLTEEDAIAAFDWGSETDRAFLEQVMPHCREAALRRLARRWLADHPANTTVRGAMRDLYATLTNTPFENQTTLRDALAIALRETLSDIATRAALQLTLREAGVAAPSIDGIDPVSYSHARAAKRCGFANFEPDADGVVRRMQLLARHRGDVFGQLAFTLVLDALQTPVEQIVARREELEIPVASGPPLRIQLDDSGRALLPWLPERAWERQFGEHVPADALWSVARHRGFLTHNHDAAREEMRQLLEVPFFADGGEYAKDLDDAIKLRSDLRGARYRGQTNDVEALSPLLAQLEGGLDQRERLAVQRLSDARTKASEADRAALDELWAKVESWRRYDAANQNAQRVIDETLAWLRPRVAGKFCLIGYTATSVADMKPIPTNKSAPGVLAHANLLNGLLTGRTVSWTSPVTNQVLTASLGMFASLLSLNRRPRMALVCVAALLILVLLLAGYVAFHQWLLWVAITPPVLAIVSAHFAIAAYRYIFVDSERRQLSTALGQYTSKEIARQVADNPELCQRAESREVTAMFTDLKGFTTISERIGAERTQRVLNVCLGRFTEVMLQHDAMVNKFIGDGIFAFWNPVIYPQPDHARRACETTLDLLEALTELKRAEIAAGGDDTFESLFLRVGVATGNAVVGPCGSEQKYDYTCIGDSVNVASRLESANKFFGTAALVGEVTQQQTREWFDFRPLGGVQVKGKTRPTQVYELLARRGQSSAEMREYGEQFAAALALFSTRDWSKALDEFAELSQRRPDDLAAQNYREEIERLVAKPPGDDWNGAIELREK